MTSTQHKRYVDAETDLNKNNLKKKQHKDHWGRSCDERRAGGEEAAEEEQEQGREISSSSGESGAAITAPSYGLCYRLRFSPLQRGSEEFMWLLRRAALERRDRGGGREEMGARGEEERREGKSRGKGSVSTRVARHRQRTKQEAAGVQRLKTRSPDMSRMR